MNLHAGIVRLPHCDKPMKRNPAQVIEALKTRSSARAKLRDDRGWNFWAILSEWCPDVDITKAPSADHLIYQMLLEQQGILLAAGPLTGSDAKRFGGLIIIRAANRREAEKIAANDPMHLSGYRDYKLYGWSLNEGQMTVTIKLGANEVDIE